MLLSLKQAQIVCADYQHLIGNQIKKGWKTIAIIEEILVVPFDDFNKHRFLEEYKKTKNYNRALDFYTGKIYDLLIIGKPILNPRDVYTCDLRKYLTDSGQPFSPERYLERELELH
jgi:hypothetical protein